MSCNPCYFGNEIHLEIIKIINHLVVILVILEMKYIQEDFMKQVNAVVILVILEMKYIIYNIIFCRSIIYTRNATKKLHLSAPSTMYSKRFL